MSYELRRLTSLECLADYVDILLVPPLHKYIVQTICDGVTLTIQYEKFRNIFKSITLKNITSNDTGYTGECHNAFKT
eukprot:15365560-Ditylum_brightwellii.AAC.1